MGKPYSMDLRGCDSIGTWLLFNSTVVAQQSRAPRLFAPVSSRRCFVC